MSTDNNMEYLRFFFDVYVAIAVDIWLMEYKSFTKFRQPSVNFTIRGFRDSIPVRKLHARC